MAALISVPGECEAKFANNAIITNSKMKTIFTGAHPKAGTSHKMQTVRFFNVTLLGIYRWLVTFGSARGLIEILSAILKSKKHGGQLRERL